MKVKYELAIKYYIEMDNIQQINLTYEELEGFNQVYESFSYYCMMDKQIIESFNTDRINQQR